MSFKPSTLELLIREIALVLTRLSSGLHPEGLRDLFQTLGWQVPESFTTIGLDPALLESLETAYAAVVEMDLELPDDSTAQLNYQALTSAVVAFATHVINITSNFTQYFDEQFVNQSEINTSEFRNRLISYLIVEYLRNVEYRLFYFLQMLGVAELVDYPRNDDILQSEHTRRVVHYDRIPTLLTDPRSLFGKAELYGWGTPSANLNLLIERLHDFLLALGLPVYLDYPGLVKETNLSRPVAVPQEGEAQIRELAAPIFTASEEDQETEVGFTLFPVPGDPDAPVPLLPGLALCPYATGDFAATIPLDPSELWLLELSGNLDLKLGLGIILRPDQDISVTTDLLGQGAAASGNFLMKVRRVTWPDEPIKLFSLSDGSGLTLREVYIASGIGLDRDQKLEIIAELGCLGLSLALKGTGGDSFLSSLLPEGGIRADFDLIVGWSRTQGIYFRGSSALELKIPTHLSLGPVDVDNLYLTIRPDSTRSISLEVSASVTGRLGVLTVTIDRIGMGGAFAFPESGGNLGLLDVTLDFKSPTGIGLAIKGGGITGGGFLSFDKDNGRYVGIMQLSFQGTVSLQAIGLLNTSLPEGGPDFSLLVLINTEFLPAIQLGYGFSLKRAGGLLGLNRTVNLDVLREGVQTGVLDSLLFPSDPVANAPQIISDLETVFPSQPDHFVFGPMARIGWGTPPLIAIDLGLLFELPGPARFAILGALRARLPSEDKEILRLQVGFLGVIDLGAQELAFNASLYDSRLLTLTLSGDMALRLNWGDNPCFLLSVGGFHPAFQPPADLASMQRLTINLLRGNNPRLTLEGYFAITSNTVQFGARVELYAAVSKFNIYGFLGFDVLLQFSPFCFIAQVKAGLAVRIGSTTIMGVTLEFALSGPTPWNARGKARFTICWFIKFTVHFNETWGESLDTTFDDEDVLPLLVAALSDSGNWRAEPPGRREMLVTLKEIPAVQDEAGKPKVLVHPFGALSVSQKVVPLGITISRFGNVRPRGMNCFTIESVTCGDAAIGDLPTLETDPVTDEFARAQFVELSDAERLSEQSFTKVPSGVSLKASETLCASRLYTRHIVEYEEDIVDPGLPSGHGKWQPPKFEFDRSVRFRLDDLQSPLGPASFYLRDEEYAVVCKVDMVGLGEDLLGGLDSVFPSYWEAFEAMSTVLVSNPEMANTVQVVPAFEAV
jgi:hypothetical protein